MIQYKEQDSFIFSIPQRVLVLWIYSVSCSRVDVIVNISFMVLVSHKAHFPEDRYDHFWPYYRPGI